MDNMTQKELNIGAEDVQERLDKVLVKHNEDYSRHQMQLLIKEGKVLVNGKKVKPNYKCKLSDVVTWTLKEETKQRLEPESLPLSILYEDEAIIVIDKPRGMLVHPTERVFSGTLVNALLNYTDELATLSGKERPGIVHRLDQHTSGVMVICKTNESYEKLKNQFKKKSVTRYYEAIVHGNLTHEKGTIKAPIGRHPKNRLKRTVIADGKEAETNFKVLANTKDYSHVQCQLITGRTHQIRVHMKYINHPIVGDPLYSRKKSPYIEHQALIARTLGFIHPLTKEYVEFTCERPEWFKKLLLLFHLKA